MTEQVTPERAFALDLAARGHFEPLGHPFVGLLLRHFLNILPGTRRAIPSIIVAACESGEAEVVYQHNDPPVRPAGTGEYNAGLRRISTERWKNPQRPTPGNRSRDNSLHKKELPQPSLQLFGERMALMLRPPSIPGGFSTLATS
jgi:hypothetical protein